MGPHVFTFSNFDMRINQLLRNSIDLLIFKPVLVLLCKIIGIPHVYVIIFSIALLVFLVLFIGKVNKIISLLLIPSLVILAMLVTASKNPSEYLYNILLAINFFLILLLFSVNKGFENNYSSLFWRIALVITLLASSLTAGVSQAGFLSGSASRHSRQSGTWLSRNWLS